MCLLVPVISTIIQAPSAIFFANYPFRDSDCKVFIKHVLQSSLCLSLCILPFLLPRNAAVHSLVRKLVSLQLFLFRMHFLPTSEENNYTGVQLLYIRTKSIWITLFSVSIFPILSNAILYHLLHYIMVYIHFNGLLIHGLLTK